MKTLIFAIVLFGFATIGMCSDYALRVKAYIVQEGGSALEERYRVADLKDARGPHLIRWGVQGITRPKARDLPTAIEARSIVRSAKKDNDADFAQWDRRLSALAAVMAEELGISNAEMKAKIRAKLRETQ